MNWIKDNLIAVLVLALLASLVFGGWNLWRKNVYYDALHLVAAEKVAEARAAEQRMVAALRDLETDLTKRKTAREQQLEDQLADISRDPAERVVYRLRDRWLPVSCPAGAGPGDRPETVGGLQREDEIHFIRESHRADGVVEQLNACIDAYNATREAALRANR